MMALIGHSILIIDTNAAAYVVRLRAAIHDAGAKSIIARTAGTARERVKRFKFSAAVVNVEHRALAEELGILYLLYSPGEPPRIILAGLERLLLGP